ncbi:RNA exonuclease 4 [Astyanax mexicanus]|uniref:RNA exonuclease 4 n=1 Tax=Astyanax mexicanus TaxID=7994 RepID=UPI0020CB5E8F|nr:RNA exonuclease 4 [Astyanax mexicanus]
MTLKEHLTMSKGKHKGPKSDVRAATEKQAKGPDKKGEKKKKFFFQRVDKKSKEKKIQILPPKEAQQFSSNWKSLLEVLNSKQGADGKKDSSQKQVQSKAPKPQSAVKKDFHKAQRKPDKHISKTGHGPNKDLKTPQSVKTEKPETSSVQQTSKSPSAPKQHKAEKRKAKDCEGGPENNKKKKVEEVEKQPTEMDLWFDDVDPNDIEATLGAEAAEIMRKRNGSLKNNVESTESVLVKERAFEGLTSAVAMDCEMVGVGPDGEESIVARVSIVNLFGKCVYDKYVKPTEKVTDYRTAVSGIRPKDIENGESFNTVQKEVAEILKGRILVGHAVHNDLKILFLDHPKKKLRDTQKYKPFRRIAKSARPALRVLCQEVLHVKVQQGEHSSVQDAQATMRLYTLVKSQWEAELKASRGSNKPGAKSAPANNSNNEQTD